MKRRSEVSTPICHNCKWRTGVWCAHPLTNPRWVENDTPTWGTSYAYHYWCKGREWEEREGWAARLKKWWGRRGRS